MADTQSNFARSDAYLSALMQEVRSMPAANASLNLGRRTFFKLAGAGAAGLVLGFHFGDPAFAAEDAAGVRHHVALSIVGIDRSDNGYFRAKVAQEKLIAPAGIPYTIIRSTQFMEFLRGIADSSTEGNVVRLPPGLFQPIAADDVAPVVAEVALAAPRNGIVEIAGPERAPFNEIIARYLKAIGDPREVVSDPEALYFGGRVEERSLVPLGEAGLGRIGLDEWLRRSRTGA